MSNIDDLPEKVTGERPIYIDAREIAERDPGLLDCLRWVESLTRVGCTATQAVGAWLSHRSRSEPPVQLYLPHRRES